MLARAVLAALAVPLALLIGCAKSSSPGCDVDGDCAGAGRCVEGRCVARADGGRDGGRLEAGSDAPADAPPDDGARDAEADTGEDGGGGPDAGAGARLGCPLPPAPSAGGGHASSPGFSVYVRFGSPWPAGSAASPGYRACLQP